MEEDEEHISLQHWVLILIISAIPVVNVIMFIYWGCFPPLGMNKSKQNFALAVLFFMVLFLILSGISLFLEKLRYG
jgi:hypothetical protein